MWLVDLWEMSPIDVRPMLTEERDELLRFLRSLTPAQWRAATAVPGWTVKDLALHLLDDDLGWLSRGRDGDTSSLLRVEDPQALVAALAEKNQRWVEGAHGLSLRVTLGLLAWTGGQMDAYYASMDLLGEGHVGWAGTGPVPIWFDIAQDLTERWVHQMQMREATGRVEGYRDAFLPTVLRTFVWALPHQYHADAPAGTTVQVDLGAGGVWRLDRREDGAWTLHEGPVAGPDATARFSDDAGWRWLTGAAVPEGGMTFEGPPHLREPLLRVRGILA
jgi:uncharacterized protein (TIGR03083 family)